MCGRYALYGPHSRLREQFGVELPPDWDEHYNIAPSQWAPLIVAATDGAPELVMARWGLLPSWVKEPGKVPQPINAKLETAAERPMFRHAFAHRRALVPASGFYEWAVTPNGKQPYYIRPREGNFFGLGGLLEHWTGPDGPIFTFAVLTTAANETMTPIHDRMPVIIEPEAYRAWLDPTLRDPALIHEIASPCPSDAMLACRVGRSVGNPRSQGPELIEPLE